jgi:hypothetical protein
VSLDRFELLELRRPGEIQTYHAREISTARPVQVHLFVAGATPECAELLALLSHLPEAERRRVIDRGESRGFPYVVTDRLAGYVDFREWITANSRPQQPAPGPSPALSIDEQFFELFNSPAPAAAPAPDPSPAPDAMPFLPGPAAVSGFRTPMVDDDPSLLSRSIEIQAVQPRRRFLPTAFKSILWLALGVLAALAFLAGAAAFFAFRPR